MMEYLDTVKLVPDLEFSALQVRSFQTRLMPQVVLSGHGFGPKTREIGYFSVSKVIELGHVKERLVSDHE